MATVPLHVKELVKCDSGEEIVISGMAGMFPDSSDTYHLAENLLAMKDLTSEDNRRWGTNYQKIPRRNGKLFEIDKFDAEFFGIPRKQAEAIDPSGRILLEKTYEAIVDAGCNPKYFKGSNTGVFVAVFTGDTEANLFSKKIPINSYTLPGISRAMLANRISYWLDVYGPSYMVDTACSSGAYALEQAFRAMRMGICDAAIVGGSNLCLSPGTTYMINELGILSPEGRCKCFDEEANGYTRSEGIVVVVLQKRKAAKRVYARIIYAKTNCDGYKEEGVHVPSSKIQRKLLEEFYDECRVDPRLVNFVEAHATATPVGDYAEMKALEAVFLPGRENSLKIGSVKSSIGHTEAASGLCSVVKVLLSYERELILPNINLNNLRPDIEAFHNGKIKVITEPTKWEGGLAAINSFGFGGANAHILLDWNHRKKVNQGLPADNLPRLVFVSGRTKEACDIILNEVESNSLDVEYIGLLHEIFKDDILGHLCRGYTILQKDSDQQIRSIKPFSGSKNQIWFVYAGMGSQWPQMGQALMKIPRFADSIRQCHRILAIKGFNLIKVLTEENEKT